jgi:hypothetical protein
MAKLDSENGEQKQGEKDEKRECTEGIHLNGKRPSEC